MEERDYEQELFAQRTPYLQWLAQQEAEMERQYGKTQRQQDSVWPGIRMIPFSSCMDCVGSLAGDVSVDHAALCLFVKRDGVLSPYAWSVTADAFLENGQAVFAYADEDYRGSLKALYHIENGEFADDTVRQYHFGMGEDFRGEPWFKPDFSPDTLECFFYIGSIFAVRRDRLCAAMETYGSEISLYRLVYNMLTEECMDTREASKRIMHIPKVLYTNDDLETAYMLPGLGEIRNRRNIGMIREAGACSEFSDGKNCRVSFIIPSKDHAELLAACIESLITYTNYGNYELIIVDNGSCAEQQAHIYQLAGKFNEEHPDIAITYLYEEMEFNFSKMCNIGAKAANGDYLLFFNDDIEVMDTKEGRNWLACMMEYAQKEHVGAVGAKLYYPGCTGQQMCHKIQHAGITNMGIGPAHKLGGMEDSGCLYHGHNMVNYDMLAVTAACMLVRRAVFVRMGGFDEELAVAYNDVEFCFRLYEAGLYNVQVNDAALLHHESLSRGQDTAPEKQQRLAREKEKLYEKHPSLKGKDPFYSPNLVQWKRDAAYHAGYLFSFEKPVKPHQPSKERCSKMKKRYTDYLRYSMSGPDESKQQRRKTWKSFLSKAYLKVSGNNLPMLQIDSVDYEGKWAVIKGWYVLQKHDNAQLDRKLWLIRLTRDADYLKSYEFAFLPQLREDVASFMRTGVQRKNVSRADGRPARRPVERSIPARLYTGVQRKNASRADGRPARRSVEKSIPARLHTGVQKRESGSAANTMLSGIHLVVDTAELMEGSYTLCVLAGNGRRQFAAFAENGVILKV